MPNPPAGSPTNLGRFEPSNRCELGCSASPATQLALQMVKPCCCTVSPYDIHSYVDVILLLADAGLRVIVPYLRGHGPTRFLDPSTARSGQQAAIGADVIALLDVLDIPRAKDLVPLLVF